MALGVIDQRGKQPPKDPTDDSYTITVIGPSRLRISVHETDGEMKSCITVSEFNAWSLIGTLSLFVGLKLPESIAKRIKL